MPQFLPGESKTAMAPITVKPPELSCEAELYLVSDSTKVATSGKMPFVSTGAEQSMGFPLTMPMAEGTYPIYLDVFTNGQLIGSYQAVEDALVALPRGKILEITWRDGGIWHPISDPMPAFSTITHRFRVRNTGNIRALFKIGYSWTDIYGEHWAYSGSVDIQPVGEANMDWGLSTGEAGTTTATYHLFGDDIKVDSMTAIVRVWECTPGDAECRATDLYICSSEGRWDLAEVDSPQCMTELQKVLKQIEEGTWTATVAQLDAIADWPAENYDTVLNAAYNFAASKAAAEEATTGEAHYVWWSVAGGFSTVSASEVGMSTEVLLAAEGKIQEAIETGFTASYSQLEDLESLVGTGDTYEAAIDAAYEAAASEAAAEEAATGEDYYVSWSADEGYSTVSASEVYSDPGDWIW